MADTRVILDKAQLIRIPLNIDKSPSAKQQSTQRFIEIARRNNRECPCFFLINIKDTESYQLISNIPPFDSISLKEKKEFQYAIIDHPTLLDSLQLRLGSGAHHMIANGSAYVYAAGEIILCANRIIAIDDASGGYHLEKPFDEKKYYDSVMHAFQTCGVPNNIFKKTFKVFTPVSSLISDKKESQRSLPTVEIPSRALAGTDEGAGPAALRASMPSLPLRSLGALGLSEGAGPITHRASTPSFPLRSLGAVGVSDGTGPGMRRASMPTLPLRASAPLIVAGGASSSELSVSGSTLPTPPTIARTSLSVGVVEKTGAPSALGPSLSPKTLRALSSSVFALTTSSSLSEPKTDSILLSPSSTARHSFSQKSPTKKL